MLSAAICFLVVASSWAMFVPHDPPQEYDPDPSEEPIPINPLEPFWGRGFYKKAHHIIPFLGKIRERGYAPPDDDDEHSDQKDIHPPFIPQPSKMDNTKQSAQVINNYYVFAKTIDKFFDVENGALPWSPPAKSAKRENFETDEKAPKLPEKMIPQLPNLPPIVENGKHSNALDSLKGFMQGLELLLNQKTSELGGGPETTGTATPVLEDEESFIQGSQTETEETGPHPVGEPQTPEEKHLPELDGGPKTTGSATPVTEDKEESSKGAQPPVEKNSETETDEEPPIRIPDPPVMIPDDGVAIEHIVVSKTS